MVCGDQAIESEGGGRKAREEATAVVQTDDGGLDQDGEKG